MLATALLECGIQISLNNNTISKAWYPRGPREPILVHEENPNCAFVMCEPAMRVVPGIEAVP
jgi:hypothetical protein